MAISVYVAELRHERSGKATAIVIIEPSAFSAFRIELSFEDHGDDERNLHYVQGALQQFSYSLEDALRRPLKIVRKPAGQA